MSQSCASLCNVETPAVCHASRSKISRPLSLKSAAGPKFPPATHNFEPPFVFKRPFRKCWKTECRNERAKFRKKTRIFCNVHFSTSEKQTLK